MNEKRFDNFILKKIPLSLDYYYLDVKNKVIPKYGDSGVLVIIFFPTPDTPKIIFTKRSSKLRNHAGEISFPGGRFCQKDKSLIETAIRETYEEIGLKIQKENILGCLTPTNTYTTKIIIYPFVAVLYGPPTNLTPNEEVEEILEISLEKLVKSMEIDKEHTLGNYEMFKFAVNDNLIWGATGRILKDLIDVINDIHSSGVSEAETKNYS
jgi:8-oxo-dGTP pyrophosphatase MutT (NUDIX family)